MSDLSLRLQQAHSQLPVSSYFDEQLFQRELQVLFQHGPRYVGHSRSVPEVGDYHVLPQELGGRALVRTPTGGMHAYYPATPDVTQPCWQAARAGVDFRGDGGYVIAGLIGNGDAFVVRDPAGIRPCWYFKSDEVVAVARIS